MTQDELTQKAYMSVINDVMYLHLQNFSLGNLPKYK